MLGSPSLIIILKATLVTNQTTFTLPFFTLPYLTLPYLNSLIKVIPYSKSLPIVCPTQLVSPPP